MDGWTRTVSPLRPQKSQPIYCDTSVAIAMKLGLHYCTIQLKSIRHCVETPKWCWWSNFSFYLHTVSLWFPVFLPILTFLPDKRSKNVVNATYWWWRLIFCTWIYPQTSTLMGGCWSAQRFKTTSRSTSQTRPEMLMDSFCIQNTCDVSNTHKHTHTQFHNLLTFELKVNHPISCMILTVKWLCEGK